MITFTNVSKSFNGHTVLNNINLKLPRYGLVVIQGPSGCGKTTLLNLLSGLLPFKGNINLDGHNIGSMNQNQMDEFRLKNYGFVFQDFKLFESETVMTNIIFPLESVSTASKETKNRKVLDLINMVGLKKSAKQRVNKLSGGEKQRVAIARALVNSPKIILADEPTGALDSVNAIEIMKILQKVSSNALVVMVSHDEELSNEYADMIVQMKDGEIIRITHQEKNKKEKYIPISRMLYSNKRPSASSSFLFNHTLTSIKQKKFRTAICNGVTSLGLIGVGLATTLSSSISTNIKKSYSQIVDDTKIAMTIKDTDKSIYGQYAASYYEVMDLTETYSEHIFDVGCTYYNDFESFFPQANCISLADISYYYPLTGITARDINEFRWLDKEHPETIYPEDITSLENDEVVLSLTIDMINSICYGLHIERTVLSLSRYLQTNELKMYFNFQNDYWQYSDQQIFKVVGFTLEKEPGIYHSNHMWNEYMFEERMRFPTIDNLTEQPALPWYLKKIYYLYANTDVSKFLSFARHTKDFDPYILEIANKAFYSRLLKEKEPIDTQRVLVFANTIGGIPMSYYSLMQSVSDEISSPIYGSNFGYSIYPSSMMFGFSNFTYFSGSEDSRDQTIDINTNLTPGGNENIELPSDVLCGHFSQSLTGGVNYRIVNRVDRGKIPENINEIAISSSMEKVLFGEDAIGKTIYIAYLYSQLKNTNGEIVKQYKTTEIEVVGVVNDEKNVVYHDDDWAIGFFQVMLGVSAFNLVPNSLMVDVKNQKHLTDIANELRKSFPELEVYEPMSDINQSVNQVCTYIQIALMCFSIIAVVISTLLLSICNYLYVLENKKDIGLVRCIGLNKREARKFVMTHSVVMCFISFALSAFELLGITFLISFEMARQAGTSMAFAFDPMALVYMFALAFVISLISSIFISNKLNKLDPIAALKA